MQSDRKTKEVVLKLRYTKSKVDKERGIFHGGVALPKYLREFFIDIVDDYDFDMETEEFNKNGMYAIEISGTKRALKEIGKFFVNIAMFQTKDEDYHEHIDQLCNSDGNPIANIIIRKKTP